MSRTMKADSTESFRVIVLWAENTRGSRVTETFGPFANIGTAKSVGRRETSNHLGPLLGWEYRIQRTATDWQDIE